MINKELKLIKNLADILKIDINVDETMLDRILIMGAVEAYQLDVRTGNDYIDMDWLMWEDIKKAASESKWMPPEYTMNDWVCDISDYLRDGYGDEYDKQ